MVFFLPQNQHLLLLMRDINVIPTLLNYFFSLTFLKIIFFLMYCSFMRLFHCVNLALFIQHNVQHTFLRISVVNESWNFSVVICSEIIYPSLIKSILFIRNSKLGLNPSICFLYLLWTLCNFALLVFLGEFFKL
jgi:hypothetical protein